MTAEDFCRLALSQPGAVESFARVVQTFGCGENRSQIFASLESHGPAHAGTASDAHASSPNCFRAGARWLGSARSYKCLLAHANEAIVESALILAWRDVAPKLLVKSIDEPEASPPLRLPSNDQKQQVNPRLLPRNTYMLHFRHSLRIFQI